MQTGPGRVSFLAIRTRRFFESAAAEGEHLRSRQPSPDTIEGYQAPARPNSAGAPTTLPADIRRGQPAACIEPSGTSMRNSMVAADRAVPGRGLRQREHTSSFHNALR